MAEPLFNKVADIWNLRDLMQNNQLIFMYSGHFDNNEVLEFLKIVELKFCQNKDGRIKKKALHILIEMLQNIASHKGQNVKNLPEFLLVIGQNENGNYFVQTGNIIEDEQEENISKQINRINSMGADGLKSLFRIILEFGNNPDNRGIGMGLINIARVSRSKLQYNFIKNDKGYKFFTLKAEIELYNSGKHIRHVLKSATCELNNLLLGSTTVRPFQPAGKNNNANK